MPRDRIFARVHSVPALTDFRNSQMPVTALERKQTEPKTSKFKSKPRETLRPHESCSSQNLNTNPGSLWPGACLPWLSAAAEFGPGAEESPGSRFRSSRAWIQSLMVFRVEVSGFSVSSFKQSLAPVPRFGIHGSCPELVYESLASADGVSCYFAQACCRTVEFRTSQHQL